MKMKTIIKSWKEEKQKENNFVKVDILNKKIKEIPREDQVFLNNIKEFFLNLQFLREHVMLKKQ